MSMGSHLNFMYVKQEFRCTCGSSYVSLLELLYIPVTHLILLPIGSSFCFRKRSLSLTIFRPLPSNCRSRDLKEAKRSLNLFGDFRIKALAQGVRYNHVYLPKSQLPSYCMFGAPMKDGFAASQLSSRHLILPCPAVAVRLQILQTTPRGPTNLKWM